jgi:hypothetical protein
VPIVHALYCSNTTFMPDFNALFSQVNLLLRNE